MGRIALIVVGLLLVLAGVVFMLQGRGDIGGSAMSGHAQWAVIGPIIALVGLGLFGYGWRRPSAARTLGHRPEGSDRG